MKAYCVFPGYNMFDEGCVLVYAEKRTKARCIAKNSGPWIGLDYIDFKALRVKSFDQYFNGRTIYDTNDGLPEPFFIEDEGE